MNNYNNYNMQNQVPTFSVLEDIQDNNNDDNNWKKMYDSSLMAPSLVLPAYEPENKFGYDTTGYVSSSEPRISKRYNQMIDSNDYLVQNLKDNNMSTWSNPLPDKVKLPSFVPPYGTTYPSAKYSPYDAALAYESGFIAATSQPSVPVSSVAAMTNAQNQTSIPLNQSVVTSQLTLEDIKSVLDSKIKEHYGQLSNQITGKINQTHDTNCSEVIKHAQSCPVCTGYMTSNTATDLKVYRVIIVMLIIVVIILFIIVLRKKK